MKLLNTQIISVAKFFFLILFSIGNFIEVDAQSSDFNFYRIGISGKKTQLTELMNSQFKKEFYTKKGVIYFVQYNENNKEIIQYDSLKFPVNYFLLIADKVYQKENFVYVDENLGELSNSEQNELQDFFTINREIKKEIHGFDCFQVIMKDPQGGSTSIKMFVTESLPNLPNHFPLASNIINGEALEIEMNLMGATIKVEIVSSKSHVNFEEELGIQLDKAILISEKEYEILKLR